MPLQSFQTSVITTSSGVIGGVTKAVNSGFTLCSISIPHVIDVAFYAAISAFKTLDSLLEKITFELLNADGKMLLTADHGNCEEMISIDGKVLTNHSMNEVPFVYISNDVSEIRAGESGLSDISPTIVRLLGLEQPKEMTGNSIIG